MSMIHESYAPSRPSSTNDIQKLIRDILLSTRIMIQDMNPLPYHLHRISTLRLSNDSRLILKLPPSTTTAVLRHERQYLASEAAILTLLSKSNLPIPQILKYETRSNLLGSSFLLTTEIPGIIYADVFTFLTRSQRDDVEQQLDALVTHLSSYSSVNFGSAAKVAAGSGSSTWREAFRCMLDPILMDGEDMMVNLPYTQIKETFNVWGKHLNEVQEARLVVLGMGRKENVKIERKTNDVTGVLDFGRAVWGDVAFANEEITLCGEKGVRGLL